MNTTAMINKLIFALNRNYGCSFKINQEQFFSDAFDKICTKYVLFEVHPNDDGIVFFSKTKLLKYLVELYKQNKGGES